eukprot:scaffold569_cov165-Amphora_coffeaeformis.AAC.24
MADGGVATNFAVFGANPLAPPQRQANNRVKEKGNERMARPFTLFFFGTRESSAICAATESCEARFTQQTMNQSDRFSLF